MAGCRTALQALDRHAPPIGLERGTALGLRAGIDGLYTLHPMPAARLPHLASLDELGKPFGDQFLGEPDPPGKPRDALPAARPFDLERAQDGVRPGRFVGGRAGSAQRPPARRYRRHARRVDQAGEQIEQPTARRLNETQELG